MLMFSEDIDLSISAPWLADSLNACAYANMSSLDTVAT